MEQKDQKWMQHIILFMAGQTVSLFGSAIVQYAITWHITLTTKSGFMLTMITVCGFLPQVLISLFSGVWADRYSRKMLIMLSDGMIAFSTLVLAILFMMGYTHIQFLFIISAVRSLGTGIQMPAVNALLPDLAPQEKLMQINGLNAGINNIMFLIAPAVAGGLYSFTQLDVIFWIDVITAVVAIVLLSFVKAPHKKHIRPDSQPQPYTPVWDNDPGDEKTASEPQLNFFKDMMLGLHYMKETRWLKQFLLFYILLALMLGPVVFLTPLMVARSFGPESWRLAAHEMIFSVGGIIGGLSIGMVARRITNQIYILIGSCVFFGLTTFIMGFSTNFWFYLSIMFLMGISMPFINTSFTTVVQTHTKPELLGRVFGLVTIAGSSAMPLSTVIFGPIADHVSIELLLLITGAAMTAISFMMLRFKDIMIIGKAPLNSANQE